MTNINDIKLSLPENIVDSGYFTENDLRVLDALLFFNASEYAKSNGEFFTTNQRLRKQAEIKNNPTLYRALKKFNDHGFITRTPGKEGEASVYIIHDDAIRDFNKSKQKMGKNKKTPVTNAKNMLPTLNTNELRAIIEELVTPLSNRVTKLEEEIANLLKISMGNQNATVTDQNERNSLRISMGNQNEDGGNKNGLVTTETETDTEKEKEKETLVTNMSSNHSTCSGKVVTCNHLTSAGNAESGFMTERETSLSADANAPSTDVSANDDSSSYNYEESSLSASGNTPSAHSTGQTLDEHLREQVRLENEMLDGGSTNPQCEAYKKKNLPPTPLRTEPREYSVYARRKVNLNGKQTELNPDIIRMMHEGAELRYRIGEEGVFEEWHELKLSVDRGARQQDPTGQLSTTLINMFNNGETPSEAPKEYVMDEPTTTAVMELPTRTRHYGRKNASWRA